MKTTTIIAIVTAVLAVLTVVLLFVFAKPVRRTALSKTKRIVYVALMTAVCAVMNIFTIPISNSVWITFTALPCFIAGYMFGCIDGFAVGFIGDLIGALIHPQGAYMPIIGLASGMWGFVPGVIFSYFKGNDNLKAIISYLICFLLCTVFLNTFGLWLLYGIGKKTFWVYLWARLPWQSFNTLLNMFLALALLTFLPQLVKNRTDVREPEDREEQRVKRCEYAADKHEAQ